jgi:hypothetical protein
MLWPIAMEPSLIDTDANGHNAHTSYVWGTVSRHAGRDSTRAYHARMFR